MSQPQRIIIDGYNVIYTDDTLRPIAIKDLERARDMLVGWLETYVANRDIQVTLVFDGKGQMTDGASVVPGKLQVIFSPGHRSADDVIVTTVKSAQNPRAYVVVSSDKTDIGSHVANLGCEVIGSKRFLSRLQRDLPRVSNDDAKKLGDTDYWLRKFGDDTDRERGA